ncbi:MAG: cadherin domain-containing protein, partial [Aureliella sp.]
DQVFKIAVTEVDEFDVGVVSDTDAAADSVTENAAIGTAVGITASASDADATTNAITYSLQSDDGGRFAIDASTGVVTVAGAIDREAGATRSITVRATSADGSHTDQLYTIAVGDVDEFDTGSISDANGAAADVVAENAANGTVVGITALASDADATNNTISYSLDDDAGGRFAIDSSTGVVTVADGSLLDYESATSHAITVRATSSDGSSSTKAFTIALSDVNEFAISATSDSDASANFTWENAAVGTLVGVTGLADDADGTDSVTYSLDDDAGGRFAIDANTGVVTVAGAIDREVASAYSITIRSTSTDGTSSSQNFSISIGDIDDFDTGPVTDSDATANAVDENAASGTAVGLTGWAVDGDATNNAITYSLDDDAGGRFAIDASTGAVTVADGSLLDRESAASHDIVIRATSVDGSSSTQTFTIAVNDVDEFDITATSDNDAAADAVDENAVNGTVVGVTALASDADATQNAITYSLDDNAGGRFAIDAATGVVTVADGSLLDRESAASHSITIRATSADGSSSTMAVTIAVNDVDEFDVSPISDTDAAANVVSENSAVGTAVPLSASASDADATNNAVTYSLDDDAGGRFAIDASTGVVTVAGGASLDYEASPTHTITIRATSSDGSSSTRNFTISLSDVDEFDVSPISDASGTTDAVDENAAAGTTVGVTALATDADGTNNTVTYSLDSDAGGRFTIDAVTGIVSVAAGADLNYEANTSHTVTVRATSADGSSSSRDFTIAVNDVDEFDVSPISDTNSASNVVLENVAPGTLVGLTAFASDADGTNNVVTYSLDLDAGGRFAIDSATGVVSVASGGPLNYEASSSHLIRVRATSADGSATTRDYTIQLVDVDEFDVSTPVDTNGTANVLPENSPAGAATGVRVNAVDADGTTNTVTYSLIDNAGGRFVIDASTGQVTAAAGADLNYEATSSYTIVARATSADGSYRDNSFAISLTNVNEAPAVDPRVFTTTNVDVLTITVQDMLSRFVDPEGDPVTVTLISGTSDGTFAWQPNGDCVYTPNAGYVGTDQFVVVASDGSLSSPQTALTISVTLPNAVNGAAGGGKSSQSSSSSNNNSSSSNSSNNSSDAATHQAGNVLAGMNYIDTSQKKPEPIRQAESSTQQVADAPETPQEKPQALQSKSSDNGEDVQMAGGPSLSLVVQRGLMESRINDDQRVVLHHASQADWVLPDDERKSEIGKRHGVMTFVEPAKWTVLSTGMVIWAVRVGQVIATFAPTATAWIQFDPLTVIQQAGSIGLSDDDKEANSISEQMFDNKK